MATSIPSSHEIVTAYRHLYKGLLRAVQYSSPARFDARNQLRDAFRREDPSTFNKERINKTVEFLGLAAQEAGLEHRIVKNLLRMNHERREQYRLRKRDAQFNPTVRQTSMVHYDMTVAMLNDSMGLCLR